MKEVQYIGGIHPVESAVTSGRPMAKIYVSESTKARARAVLNLAREQGVVIQEVNSRKLDEMLPDVRHQGIIALISPVIFSSIDEMIESAKMKGEDPLLVMLEGIEDPRNLGAIIRSAECFGVHGVIIPKRNSSPVTSATAKTAAGALERMPIAQVGNFSQEIQKLKDQGLWIAGLALEDSREIKQENLKGPLVLVLGNEGKGLSRLVKEKCDYIVRIDMLGEVGSLNVSVAAGVSFYEVQRQRKT